MNIALVPNVQANEQSADLVFQMVKQQGLEAGGDVGKAGVIDVLDRISVPVDYSTAPPTRSKRGESPRMDTGELHQNVTWEGEETSDRIIITVSSSRPSTPEVPEELEYEAKRPYMEPSFLHIEDIAPQIIADVLRQ